MQKVSEPTKDKNRELGKKKQSGTKRMVEEEKTLNPIYIVPEDLLEEIFLRLPLKSILRFKAVSKEWRSIMESRSFAERRMKAEKKNPKILAVGDHRTESRFTLDAGEIEVVCLRGDAAKRPSLTCEGLVCIPVPGCVNILNPSTGEYISFPSGMDPVTRRFDYIFFAGKTIYIYIYICVWRSKYFHLRSIYQKKKIYIYIYNIYILF